MVVDMKKIFPLLLLAALAIGCQNNGLTRFVNPFVGTDFHGHTYPGAIAPFGQIQPSPDTRLEGWDGCSAYHYSDDTIYGFSHTHLSGTGCEDYGDILLMPVMAEDEDWSFSAGMPQEEFLSRFSHRSEKAEPGYYRVVLDRNRVMAELTTSERVACHRYTFPSTGKKGFVIDLCHRDKVIAAGFEKNVPEGIIAGYRESNAWNPDQKCFFALECNRPITKVTYFDNNRKALVELPLDCKDVEVYVSISGVDCKGAQANLATREGRTFDKIRTATRRQWEEKLAKISVEGGSTRERRNFYTALYHCYTSPYLWSDVDGRYRGMDDSIRTSETPIYTVFSLWDTYRALHPLMAIIEPEITEQWINTMYRQYEAGGELTMWELASHETHCMIGYHACPVILEAQQAGILDSWSPQRRIDLLKAMVATSNRSEAHLSYNRTGYLDSQEDNESVSKTLEFAYDDWCIATYAQREAQRGASMLNDSTKAYLAQVVETYMRRANSWQNIMDEQGFMHARRNGGFVTPFDPTEVNNHFTEANSWQYSSYVPHDVYEWIRLQGGNEKAGAFLDSLFNTSSATSGREQSDITGMIGQYAHGNEPSHHAAYLYAYLGESNKLNKVVHQVLDELYTPKPDGLCGNEDCGQMSAWYVMSAMGFYPVCPGTGEFVTVTPLFDRVNINNGTPNSLIIDKNNWQPGKFWRDGQFNDSSICFMPEQFHRTPAPYFGDWQLSFEDSTFITLNIKKEFADKAEIYYTLDGREPDNTCTRYTQPIKITHDVTIKAVAYTAERGYSPVVSHKMQRFAADKRLTYVTKPADQYFENGGQGLIDRVYGTTNYRIGGWQGWQTDAEVVIDLLQPKTLTSVGVDCLENMRSWVFFPRKVEVSVSLDGKTYTPWATVENTEYPTTLERQEESVQHTFTCQGAWSSVRYVKIKAVNHGAMPAWHVSAGEQAWVFIDEIEIGTYVPTFYSAE